jgi:hypothetical protein
MINNSMIDLSLNPIDPFPAIPKDIEQGQTTLDFYRLSTVRKKPVKPAKPSYKVPTRVYL